MSKVTIQELYTETQIAKETLLVLLRQVDALIGVSCVYLERLHDRTKIIPVLTNARFLGEAPGSIADNLRQAMDSYAEKAIRYYKKDGKELCAVNLVRNMDIVDLKEEYVEVT